jgi:riboflavin transporter FmnP
MDTTWFKRFGWTYIPTTFMGMAVTILAVAFIIPVFACFLRNGQTESDNWYQMFVYTTCVAFWWKWIAEKTS